MGINDLGAIKEEGYSDEKNLDGGRYMGVHR